MGQRVKDQLLQYMLSGEAEYVSGQQLAARIGCSRTAIWKAMEELKKEGFEIEAIRNKGYRLLNEHVKLYPARIQQLLSTNTFGRSVYVYDSVQSTQLLAHELAKEGAKEGTVVLAEEQTGGKGRMARPWHSAKGSGIWMSLLLRPTLPPQFTPQFTLLAAVAVTEAVQQVTGVSAEIKWPNDLLIDGKKTTGILTELQAEADRVDYIVMGIGINVHRTSFPPELSQIATCLEEHACEPVDRTKLVCKILEKLETYNALYMEVGFEPIRRLWEARSYTIGKEVTLKTSTTTRTGIAIGLDENGTLLARDKDGELFSIYTADIHTR
ncbi:biotin--[acetyl-CoA-carboxylase] ligase [Bacillus fonticola]|uniref:biotin--[acetyl-CoA-carboxylase] ligase n=1 Tax=Bacillus fonticola TaxID=2728853 RepID=UPI001472CD99|nr:biotin--[acetyl-CoA-carboxylase] ligase [Bacillus fonticola]